MRMIGQESIRSNPPSYIESRTVLQKHKAAIQKPNKKPPHPRFPHPVPSPQVCVPINKRRYVLNHLSSRLIMAAGYPGIDIAIGNNGDTISIVDGVGMKSYVQPHGTSSTSGSGCVAALKLVFVVITSNKL
jgi:hypothetical protein